LWLSAAAAEVVAVMALAAEVVVLAGKIISPSFLDKVIQWW
jgi:hypothetical protein